ncbi:hypothetical protein RFI_39245, partial [Reticulomyxa filosa]
IRNIQMTRANTDRKKRILYKKKVFSKQRIFIIVNVGKNSASQFISHKKIKEKMENRRRAVSVLATSAQSMHSRTPDGSEKVEEKHNKMLECGDFPQNQKQHFQVPPQLEWKEEMETAIDNRKYWDTLDQMLKTLWLGIGIIRLNFGEKKCFIGTGCVFYVRKEEVYALTWSGNLECIDTNTKEKKTLKKAWFERRETSKAWIGVTSESKAIYSICEYWEHGHFAVMKNVWFRMQKAKD